MKALIVEDDFTQRFGLKIALTKEGYDITEAEDGKSALKIIQTSEKFDLVILDYNLGDIKGTTLAKEIKKYDNAKKIVLVSSQVDEFIGHIDGDIEVFSKPIKEVDVQKITAIGYRNEDINSLRSEIKSKGISESIDIESISSLGNSTAIKTLIGEVKKNNNRDIILFEKSQINSDILYTILLKQQDLQKDFQYVSSELKRLQEERANERLIKIEERETITIKNKERQLNAYNIFIAAIGVIISVLIAIFS